MPRLSDVVPPALRCAASRRRARLAENHGKPSLWVFITAPWYNPLVSGLSCPKLVLAGAVHAGSRPIFSVGQFAGPHYAILAKAAEFCGGAEAVVVGVENGRERKPGQYATESYQGAVIKTHRDGLPWFSARRARRRDAAHRKAGGTTSESLGKPPYGSRPLIAGGRQEA